MGLTPTYRVFANEADITAAIQSRLIRLNYTDASGYESDALEIVLADGKDEPVRIPSTGAELMLFLGYDGRAEYMGDFVCDELELSGFPSEMTIRARSAVFDTSKNGKNELQSQKTREWKKDTTIGAMVKKIAGEHSLEGAVSRSLENIKLPHIVQTDESDLNFLIRVGRKYDAIVKPAGGKLVFAKKGEGTSVTGEELPPVTLTPNMVSRYRMVTSTREDAGMVVAYWHAVKNAKRHEVKVGSGEPVTRLKMNYPTSEMALAAARAELDRRKRHKTTISIQLPGRPDIMAEGKLYLAGFRDGIEVEWVITRVQHTIDASGGYVCQVEAELPNDGIEAEAEDTEN
jgi:uncharacterized protein